MQSGLRVASRFLRALRNPREYTRTYIKALIAGEADLGLEVSDLRLRTIIRRRLARVSFDRGGRRPRSRRLRVGLIITAVLAVAIWMLFEMRISPIIEQMALSRVKYLATKSINDAITEEISNGKLNYEDLVYFEKDDTGKITALKTNMVTINKLKVDIMEKVLDSIGNLPLSQLSIPLGNVINGDLLSGLGPMIPIRILPVGSVNATFSNIFTSAGINQTRHQVVMDVGVNISVIMPGKSIGTEVRVSFNVAETIIVGEVPQSFTFFDETVTKPQETNAQKYFDMR